jgi:alkylation response protein AidB-like acyl-CoA dehydrogenase
LLAPRAHTQAHEHRHDTSALLTGLLEKICRDARVRKIYEGTSNLQLRTIGRQVLE